ncbi:MAG: hypothetical protein D6776_07450 [Planctomycetota bacterium]|nr:MAG: hypothetical protein D6776_07450 [Planctomycetota bacterium]
MHAPRPDHRATAFVPPSVGRALAVLALLAAALPAASADTVQLEDGRQLRGKIVLEEIGGPIRIVDADGAAHTVARSRIRAIVRDEPEGGYIRLARYSEHWARLEVASVTLVQPSTGKQVTLAGAVHIADPAYYRSLQRRLDEHDLVLFEGVGADSSEDLRTIRLPDAAQRARELRRRPPGFPPPPSDPGPLDPLTTLQTLMGRALDLTFQKDALTYERSWWKPADVSVEELKALLAESGVGPLELLRTRADREAEQQFERTMARALQDLAASLVTGKPLQAILKESFGELLVLQMTGADAHGAGAVQKLGPLQLALIVGRNDRVEQKLDEALALEDARRIAIFYGAGHMPDLEARLARKGFRRASVEWLPAWEIRWEPRSIWERIGGGR